MRLKFDLDENLIKSLDLSDNEEIWYAIPFDLSADNTYTSMSYVVVTNTRIISIAESKKLYDFSLKACVKLVCESMVNNGALRLYFKDGKAILLARCSMKHIVRFSYVARGATMLMEGKFYKVESMEDESTCPVCGAILEGRRNCPNCGDKSSSMKKVVKICKPFAIQFLLISLITVISSAVALLGPKVKQVFIDESLANKSGTLKDVGMFLLLMLILAAVTSGLNIARTIMSTYLGSRMSMELRGRMFNKIQHLQLARIEDMKPGQLINRVTSDTTEIRQFMENTFSNAFSMILTMISSLIYMLIIDWRITLLSLAFVPVVFLVSTFLGNTFTSRFRREREKHDLLNSKLQDVISGISIVKSFGKESHEVGEFKELNRDYTKTQINNQIFFSMLFPFLTFVMNLGIYLITYSAGITVLVGSMQVGVLMQLITYAGNLYNPLEFITRLPKELSSVMNNVERIYDVLEEEDYQESDNLVDISLKGDIEFENVCFGYKSYEPVLNDVNLHIKPGEMIGLVGSSGTGKSTMINLVMNLYKVDSGVLKIDGVDINDINPESLRSQIGVVLQETFLFNGSILDNIKYSKPTATYEEIIHAAKMANAHDFIVRTPDGYNTNVGERGYNLSGGERQRIAIARAILNEPKLLILDEATSNLDTESEFLIQKALERLEQQCTTIAIAHRLSTLKNADRLVVIDNHRIAEVGSHEELIRKGGIYEGLVNAQLEMAKV